MADHRGGTTGAPRQPAARAGHDHSTRSACTTVR